MKTNRDQSGGPPQLRPLYSIQSEVQRDAVNLNINQPAVTPVHMLLPRIFPNDGAGPSVVNTTPEGVRGPSTVFLPCARMQGPSFPAPAYTTGFRITDILGDNQDPPELFGPFDSVPEGGTTPNLEPPKLIPIAQEYPQQTPLEIPKRPATPMPQSSASFWGSPFCPPGFFNPYVPPPLLPARPAWPAPVPPPPYGYRTCDAEWINPNVPAIAPLSISSPDPVPSTSKGRGATTERYTTGPTPSTSTSAGPGLLRPVDSATEVNKKRRRRQKKGSKRSFSLVWNEGTYSFKCDVCTERFTKYEKFLWHRHTNEPTFICKFCTSSYRSEYRLQAHLKKCIIRVQNLVCNICNNTFGSAAALRKHQYDHILTSPHRCTMCKEQFFSMLHVNNANEIVVFRCEFCPGTFQQFRDLHEHFVKTHKGTRLYCKECSLRRQIIEEGEAAVAAAIAASAVAEGLKTAEAAIAEPTNIPLGEVKEG